MITLPTPGGDTQTITGKEFRLSGPATLEPPYVSKIEKETTGKTETLTDQCGHTEVRKNGDSNWSITVEGIISSREKNAFDTLSRTVELLTITSEVYTGLAICENSVITQEDELNAISFPSQGYNGEESAFSFQLQLKEPQSSSGGGVIPNFS